jgi:hypothetical protein
VHAYAELLSDVFRVGKLRAKKVNLVAAADKFLDQIDCFRRSASGRRIKRFVRQEGNSERRLWRAHHMTLCNWVASIQSQFAEERRGTRVTYLPLFHEMEDLSRLGNGERNLAKPKVRTDRASGGERVIGLG